MAKAFAMTDPSGPCYADLGPFSGLVAAARGLRPLFGAERASIAELRNRAKETLRFTVADDEPRELQGGRTWVADGVCGEQLSWSVGYGPRTEGLLLKPADGAVRLPGVLALHDHSHFKFFGKEKIADGPDGRAPSIGAFREIAYGGRAYANVLARSGFVVLVHDALLWGSRKVPLETMPVREQALAETVGATLEQDYAEADIRRYNGAAYLHEHVVAKYCTVLGTSLAAVIAYEDRVALNVLRQRADVDPARIGCIGLSGGGLRASLLRATSDALAASVVVGMMSTYEGLLDGCIAPHTWMLYPAGWSESGDWPDLAASAAPSPLLVQYLCDDALFTANGMRDADARLASAFAGTGARGAYAGEFYSGPHRFDIAMQEAAFGWLRRRLAPDAPGLTA